MSDTLCCRVCGTGLESQQHRSLAFPTSPPFWRTHCSSCGWFGPVGKTAEKAMERAKPLAVQFGAIVYPGQSEQ